MDDKTLSSFIKLVEKTELKGFSCDITSKRIILHFRNKHHRVNLTEINSFIHELDNLLTIDKDKILFIKEFKYLELWIPFKFDVYNLNKPIENEIVNIESFTYAIDKLINFMKGIRPNGWLGISPQKQDDLDKANQIVENLYKAKRFIEDMYSKHKSIIK
ncbi:hypothetical protein ACTS9T_05685 [Empedobacter falsenii]|uniref:hypothetical protein n=1 Tax=unclassified Empedobacter TaxID=2643773 RepID=UPI0025B87EE2|nr:MULTISPECIES: hypothetical protein [unclassified Empedobacter]